MFSTLTSKGQLTLPKNVRDFLGVRTGDKIHFTVTESGKVEIAPVRISIQDLKNILPRTTRHVSLENMEKAILEEGGSIE